jgi:hypothetical protein
LEWQEKLKAAALDEAEYAKSLTKELRSLVCDNANAIPILRGIVVFGRLAATAREAPALIDVIMSKDCPVSAALTDDDKAKLLRVKRDAEEEFPPPSVSKQDK